MNGLAAMARTHQPGLLVVDRPVVAKRKLLHAGKRSSRTVTALPLGDLHDDGHFLEL